MPTILRQDGFAIQIPTKDHEPPHVHCQRGDVSILVEIETLRIRRVDGIAKAQDKRAALRIVAAHANFLLEQWRQIHG